MSGAFQSRSRRLGFAAALIAGLLGTAPTAFAAPSKFETFPLTCGDVTFVVTGSPGFWSVGQVADAAPGTHVVSWAYSIVVTDLDTSEILYANGYTKPGDRGQESMHCFDYSESVDQDTGHLIAVDFQTDLFLPRQG